jgi:tRNA 2-thiocytidine biosynthesis protein TtcA
LCGSQENLQRKVIKEMLKDWDRKFPGRIESIFNALRNVASSHLLDTQLYDFTEFTRLGAPFAEGDTLFDHESLPMPSPDPDDIDEQATQVIQFKSV